jgi:hypothetical protein
MPQPPKNISLGLLPKMLEDAFFATASGLTDCGIEYHKAGQIAQEIMVQFISTAKDNKGRVSKQQWDQIIDSAWDKVCSADIVDFRQKLKHDDPIY